MPKFPKNTGFKLPGIGSREVNTHGNFRKDQKVEDVGYCSTTDYNMLPQGSSPLLASDEPKDWLVPDYYHTTYTGSSFPKGKEAPQRDCPEGQVLVDGKCKDPEETPPDTKDPNYGVKVTPGNKGTDEVPTQTITTPGSEEGGTGKTYKTRWGELTPGQQEKYGSLENFEIEGKKWHSEQNATTKVIDAVPATPGTSDSYKFTKDGVAGDYKEEFCAGNPGHAACTPK